VSRFVATVTAEEFVETYVRHYQTGRGRFTRKTLTFP
jgi:hypothetical protein